MRWARASHRRCARARPRPIVNASFIGNTGIFLAISVTAEWQCKYWKYGSIKLMSEKTRGRNPSFVESKKVRLVWGHSTRPPSSSPAYSSKSALHKSVPGLFLRKTMQEECSLSQPPTTHRPRVLTIPFVCVQCGSHGLRNQSLLEDKKPRSRTLSTPLRQHYALFMDCTICELISMQ